MTNIILDRQRLISCREHLGITKQEAAKRMQLSQPAYLRYESGERCPSVHIVKTMADILDTSVEYLTGKTDAIAPNSYAIKKADDPELFRIIELYKHSDLDNRRRLLSYFEKLGAKNK